MLAAREGLRGEDRVPWLVGGEETRLTSGADGAKNSIRDVMEEEAAEGGQVAAPGTVEEVEGSACGSGALLRNGILTNGGEWWQMEEEEDGDDGGGKSVTFATLATLTPRRRGACRVFGISCRRVEKEKKTEPRCCAVMRFPEIQLSQKRTLRAACLKRPTLSTARPKYHIELLRDIDTTSCPYQQ